MNAPANTEPQHGTLIIITIMLVAILEVLDSTIVNVALPAMMPSLSANQNQITWVLTAYVAASAILLPLTGYLSTRLGRKRMMIINILGFMVSSLLCGMASSLTVMVIFRACQGAFGAALMPLSQAILRESFPLNKQGKAMAIWGMGIMMAPVFGPTLGGYITENSNWRWIFYINVPICLLGLFLTLWVIPKSKPQPKSIDWLGLAFMVMGVACLQIFLDKGNESDWFNSPMILTLCLISALSIVAFFLRSLYHKDRVIDFSLYLNRNFLIASLIMLFFSGCLFSLFTVQPIMLENLFHYPIILAGQVLSPIGFASGIAMVLSSILMNRMNVKWILGPGLLLCAIGSYGLASLTLQAGIWQIVLPDIILGLGMGFIMVPLATYALVTIPKKSMTEASGLFSYGRMLGTSVGISIISTLISRETQINWHSLMTHINVYNPNLNAWLMHQHTTINNPHSLANLQATIATNASMQAFLNAYTVVAIGFTILVVLVFFLKNVNLNSKEMIH